MTSERELIEAAGALVDELVAKFVAANDRSPVVSGNVIQKRMDDRFEEHGTREGDTNACYYQGRATYRAILNRDTTR